MNMGKGKRVRGFQRDWMDSEEISETQSTEFQPIPVSSNPQHNPERPNPTKGTRPPPQRTERDSEWGEGETGGSQGREKTQPDQGNQTPTPNGQRGIQRGERV